jgi:phospholipid/cholesterol/gamma-HCH transport system substrate-binding protein
LKVSREVKTALLMIVAITLIIFGYNYLKGENLFDDSKIMYAVYDNVEGLATGSPVTINGYAVGRVQSIGFADKTGKLLVTFSIEKSFEFSKKSIAKIYGGGLLGGKSLSIIPNYEGPFAVDGDMLTAETGQGIMELVNEQLTPLQNEIEKVIIDADSVLTSVNEVLDATTRQNLRAAINDFSATASNLKGMSGSLNGMIQRNEGKLDNTLANLDTMSANFVKVSDSLSQIQIGQLMAKVENVLTDFEGIANNLKSGKGTAGKLLNDDQVYVNLERSTKQMELLLQDLRLNPKRYVHLSVFGKKAKVYTPPKDSID